MTGRESGVALHREQDLYTYLKPAEAKRGRLPRCCGSGCKEIARFTITARSFAYYGSGDAGKPTTIARATDYCELCLRKAGPMIANVFINNAIAQFLEPSVRR